MNLFGGDGYLCVFESRIGSSLDSAERLEIAVVGLRFNRRQHLPVLEGADGRPSPKPVTPRDAEDLRFGAVSRCCVGMDVGCLDNSKIITNPCLAVSLGACLTVP